MVVTRARRADGRLQVGGAEVDALDGRAVGGGPAEQDEEQAGDDSGEELGREVDGQLAPT